MADFDKYSDIIDSRDVIARIEELEAERESAIEDCDHEDCKAQEAHAADFDASEEGQELKVLRALAEEAEGSPDWKHGETLIRDSYFREYAEQLAEDIGAIPQNAGWPARCIDWEQAAEELQQDYMSVDFDGVTYWIRA